ncbi:MAG: 4'-phosphopantetheinyl transferase superfamily protein [Methylococcaceae bacterium]|jgi:4'-phosphopantetheinyl transferase
MLETVLDVWLEPLLASQPATYYKSLLNEAELLKVQRFVFERDRNRYLLAHAKLRLILAGYLNKAPEHLEFELGLYGKPALLDSVGIYFNMSHSGDHLLVVVGCVDQIGVDIECWRDGIDYHAITKQCFADSEYKTWISLSGAEKTAFFYQLWVRKESFMKAVGLGLGLNPTEVVTTSVGSSQYIALPKAYGAPTSWRLFDLKLPNKISGAITLPNNSAVSLNFKQLE